MKKGKKLGTFLSGVLAGAMIVGCGIVSFAAASGSVRFNAMDVAINGKTVIRAGESLTTARGCEIPNAICYTDELGNDTIYLPVRQLSKLLNIPVTWKNNTVYLGYAPSSPDDVTVTVGSGDSAADLPLHRAGAKAGAFTEVEPSWPANDKITSYSATEDLMSSSFAVGGRYAPFPAEGGYCSLSVTNNTGSDLLLAMDCVSTITRDAFPLTIVPAGETVIRTFQAGAYTGGLYQPQLAFNLYSGDGALMDIVSATVTVVSFDPNRTGAPLFS